MVVRINVKVKVKSATEYTESTDVIEGTLEDP